MDTAMTPQQAFSEALHRAKTQGRLAAIVGKKQPAISKRLKGSGVAEPEEAIAIERELGIPRHLLCPDIFEPASAPTSPVLPGPEVEVADGAPIVPCDRRAELKRGDA